MRKLLIATTNPAKYREFQSLLEPHGVSCLSLTQIKVTGEPVEDGETFAENSLLKANFYWQQTGLPTLTDDGGLEIDALGGQPGVHSRRLDGEWRSDGEAIKIVLDKVKDVPVAKRTARMKTVVTLRVARDRNFQSESSVEGVIKPSKLKWEDGFPYRAILWLPKFKKFLQELTPTEMSQVSHRRNAINDLMPYIQQYV